MAGDMFTVKGPIFDGTARSAIDQFTDEAARAVADVGADDLRNSTAVFKNPTGFYRSHVAFQRQGDGYQVDDGRVIYGPWLEGVSSRNHRTRFRGYSIWRRTTQRLQGKAQGIAERILPRYLGRMQ